MKGKHLVIDEAYNLSAIEPMKVPTIIDAPNPARAHITQQATTIHISEHTTTHTQWTTQIGLVSLKTPKNVECSLMQWAVEWGEYTHKEDLDVVLGDVVALVERVDVRPLQPVAGCIQEMHMNHPLKTCTLSLRTCNEIKICLTILVHIVILKFCIDSNSTIL